MELWNAWVFAKTWQVLPSEIFRISDEFAAYCFNRAVTRFGTAVESAMDSASEGAKTTAEAVRNRQKVLDTWLGIQASSVKGRFRDPAAKTQKV